MRISSLVLVLLAALPLCAFADGGGEDPKTIAPAPGVGMPYPGANMPNTGMGGCNGACQSGRSGNFQKLEAMFNSGTPPYFPNPGLVGFAGRCFVPYRDAAVKGGAYLSFNDPSRNGPIDNGSRSIASIWNDDLTHYDNMTARYAAQGATWYPACIANGSLVAQLDRSTSSFLRVSGNYYIEKVGDPSGFSASYYCYYYMTMAP